MTLDEFRERLADTGMEVSAALAELRQIKPCDDAERQEIEEIDAFLSLHRKPVDLSKLPEGGNFIPLADVLKELEGKHDDLSHQRSGGTRRPARHRPPRV